MSQHDDARAWVRDSAREGASPQDMLDDVRIKFGLSSDDGVEVVCQELRSVQEVQIQTNHDRIILDAIDHEGA